MSAIDRRSFLRGTALSVGGAALAGPFQGFLASPAFAGTGPPGQNSYGGLGPVADHRDGVVRLDLPSGFNYRSFDQTGATLSDNMVLPGRHDGMAAFPGRNASEYILVRNHEINGPVGAFGSGTPYDAAAGGGTVTTVVSRQGKVTANWTSLNGSQMNCAGGRTPWGSWITCEETVNGPTVGNDFTGQDNTLLNENHGYIFEVPGSGEISNRVPIRNAGRFAHEAAAADPATGNVYLTEDNFNFASGFYRYLPPANPMSVGHVQDGGTLEMLKVVGVANADLSVGQTPGAAYAIEWVAIASPDPNVDGLSNNDAIVAVGDQGRAAGTAIFSRLEGATYDGGKIYFTSTQGGADVGDPPFGFGDGHGQVWAYDPASSMLHLVFESPSSAVLDLPDNVTASANGTLVLCEDGSGDNFLRGLTSQGEIFDFARNADASQAGQEFAGATFSPDFHTLFVNIQSSSGYSIAIWGPWARGGFA